VEVRFKKEVMDLTVDFVYFLFLSFHEGTMDLSMLKQREHAIGERSESISTGPEDWVRVLRIRRGL
jgi:hypothetical protein